MILRKENGDWYMERKWFFGTWGFMFAFDALALFALLLVATWNTTHNDDRVEDMLLNLWGIWCLIPGIVVTIAVCFTLGVNGVKPRPVEWKPES